MAETIAALAAIIRTGTEADIATAYVELIARAGHDAADDIWDQAHNLADEQLVAHCLHCGCDGCPGCATYRRLAGSDTCSCTLEDLEGNW